MAALASFRKHLFCQIRAPHSLIIPSVSLRKAVHTSAYDKNQEDDHVCPTVVPDHVMPAQPGHYWAPHPQTGVFGPTSNHTSASADFHTKASLDCALEQKAFFRPQEDLEKPITN